MKYTLSIYLVLSLLAFGCKDGKKKGAKSESAVTETTDETSSKVGMNNYAVVWKWTTTEVQFVVDNSATISEELMSLWKEGVVENAYYNSDSKVDKLAHLPNINFFLRAHSIEDAEQILDKLTIVKKSIASYTLHHVGTLWLDRNTKAINKNGMTKSFVTIWETNNKPIDTTTKMQSDTILELWNEGKIENVYFDIQGTAYYLGVKEAKKDNSITDFVFFANVNTKEEAIALCESLPFFKEKIATYRVHEVGVFWLGKYEQN